MLTYSITEEMLKSFMNDLFLKPVFDVFEVRSVKVRHAVTFEIDGALAGDPADSAKTEGYAAWGAVKPHVTSFIKGSAKPAYIKIVFSVPRDMLANILPDAAAAFINIEYSNGAARMTTATNRKEFSLDKETDRAWDTYAREFFISNGVSCREES